MKLSAATLLNNVGSKLRCLRRLRLQAVCVMRGGLYLVMTKATPRGEQTVAGEEPRAHHNKAAQ